MSLICPRCGRVDDGTSYTCPSCYAVLQPELLPTAKAPKRDPYADGPGPAARAKAEAEAQRAAAAASGYPMGPPPGGPGAPSPAPPYPPPPYPPPPEGANPYQAPGMPPPGYGAGYGQPMTRRPLGMPDPPSYLAQSILVTLFCCMPFGIVGIVFAALTMSATGSGNWEAAESNSAKARLWVWIAFVLGLVVNFLYFMFVLSGGQRTCGGGPS